MIPPFVTIVQSFYSSNRTHKYTVGKRLKEKPRFRIVCFKGSLLDKQEAKTMPFSVLCVSLSWLGVIFAKTGGVLTLMLTFVLTLLLTLTSTATVTERKPRSTLLPSRRKTAPRHLWMKQPVDSHKSQKTAICLSARLGEEGFKNKAQTTTLDSDLLHIDTPLPPFPSFAHSLPTVQPSFTRSNVREATAMKQSKQLPRSATHALAPDNRSTIAIPSCIYANYMLSLCVYNELSEKASQHAGT